jgi:hypothetical protein
MSYLKGLWRFTVKERPAPFRHTAWADPSSGGGASGVDLQSFHPAQGGMKEFYPPQNIGGSNSRTEPLIEIKRKFSAALATIKN